MKVITVIMLAVILTAGAAMTAFASEDVVFPEQSAKPAGPPVFSAQDYQEMNDSIANPTGRGGGPAFGARYGEIYVEMPDDLLEDEAFMIAAAATTLTQDTIPMMENETQADYEARLELAEAATGNEDILHEQTPAAPGIGGAEEGHGTGHNPNTGAANVALPLVAGIAALAAVPFVRKK